MSDLAEEHKKAMQALQADHRAKMKEKQKPDRGLLAVITGNGKGKSTSGFGTVIRALGWGHSVAIVQYVKGTWKTGEHEFFKRMPDLVPFHRMGDGFTWDTQDRDKDIEAARRAWQLSYELMQSGDYDLILLDELNIVLRYGYLPVEEVLEGLANRSQRTTVVITGRDAPEALCHAADLVSEVEAVKHPFQSGIKAAPGFDY